MGSVSYITNYIQVFDWPSHWIYHRVSKHLDKLRFYEFVQLGKLLLAERDEVYYFVEYFHNYFLLTK